MLYLITSFLCFLAAIFPFFFKIARNIEYEYTLLVLFYSYTLFLLIPLFLPKGLVQKILIQIKENKLFFLAQVFIISPLCTFLLPFTVLQSDLCLCSETHFTQWFLINLYPSLIIAHGFFVLILQGRLANRWQKTIISSPFLVLILAVVQTVLFFWIFPQKRQCHLFWGYLHGPIYDLLIHLDYGIILRRVSHILLASAFLFGLLKNKKLTVFFLVLFLGAYIKSLKKPSLQYGMTHLIKNFDHKKKGEKFLLYYNKKDHDPKRIELLTKEIKFHLTELPHQLDLKHQILVPIFLYSSQKQKKLLFGASQTDVTDIFNPSIHLNSQEFPHSTLRHELVHALMSQNAPLGLGFHPNMALTEGIAVALAPDNNKMSIHTRAAHLMAHKKIPDIRELFSPLFWKYSGPRAYTVAGSLIKYILEEKGAQYAKRLYRTLNINEALGDKTDEIIKSWLEFIKKDYRPKRHDLLSEKTYRYPGLLNDTCPHSKADYFYHNTLGEEEYITWRRKLDPKDSKYFLKQLRYTLAAAQKKSSSELITQARKNLGLLTQFEKNKQNNYDFYELELVKSDLYRIAGKKKESLEILEKLVKTTRENTLSSSFVRSIIARYTIEQILSPNEAYSLRLYLAGYENLPKKPAQKHWMIDYLVFRNNFFENKQNHYKSLKDWNEYFLDNNINIEFYKEWLRLLALEKTYQMSFKEASYYWTKLVSLTRGSQRELYSQYERMSLNFLL